MIFLLIADMSHYLISHWSEANSRCIFQHKAKPNLKSRTFAVFKQSTTRQKQTTTDIPGGYLQSLKSSVKSLLCLFKRPLGHLPVGFFYNRCLSSTNVIGTSEMMADDKLDKHALKKGTTDLTTGWKAPYKHTV